MKPEDFMENICRCLERIENEVNRLSSFQAIDGRYEIDNNINKTMQSDQKMCIRDSGTVALPGIFDGLKSLFRH